MAENYQDRNHHAPIRASFLGNGLTNADKESIRSIFLKYDTNNDGIFSTEEIVLMMVDFKKANKSNSLLKKYILISACVILLLMLSNLSTSLLAIHYSKDIEISSNGLMKKPGSNKILQTGTVGNILDMNEAVNELGDKFKSKGGKIIKFSDGQWESCVSMNVIKKLFEDSMTGSTTVIHITDENGNEQFITLKGNFKKTTQDGIETGSFSDVIFYRSGCNESSEDSGLSRRYATIGSSPDGLF